MDYLLSKAVNEQRMAKEEEETKESIQHPGDQGNHLESLNIINNSQPTRLSEETSQPLVDQCPPGICGLEAACLPSADGKSHQCLCPHDSSPPTEDLRCPHRRTVPIKPSVIHNIILPEGRETTTPPNSYISNDKTESQPGIAETTSIAAESPPFTHILIGLVGGALVLTVFILIFICFWRRRHRRQNKSCSALKPLNSTLSPVNLSKGPPLERYTANPQYSATEDAVIAANIPAPLLRRTALVLCQELGEGCFGKVYKGELDLPEMGAPLPVAVKVLKETASREIEEDFLREVDVMSTFRHENILALLGVVPREADGQPCMVFELMAFGDLAHVLRKSSIDLKEPIQGLQPLDQVDQLKIASQIAAGMTYLASQRFVHRDLASRNCLVGWGLVVKIADFGMCRDVYTCDYYKVGGCRLLPVRWMPYESILYGRFTLETDVWSFGVVLWEIYTLGRQPYFGHSNEQVVKLILDGILLSPPDNCPGEVCDIMRQCWKTDAKDRIKFVDILTNLEELHLKYLEQEEISTQVEDYLVPKTHTYIETISDVI